MMKSEKHETIDNIGISNHISSLQGSARAIRELGGSAFRVAQTFQFRFTIDILRQIKQKSSKL
jgi:hypothetical protein